jgi:hypothetical protein
MSVFHPGPPGRSSAFPAGVRHLRTLASLQKPDVRSCRQRAYHQAGLYERFEVDRFDIAAGNLGYPAWFVALGVLGACYLYPHLQVLSKTDRGPLPHPLELEPHGPPKDCEVPAAAVS